MKQVKLISGVIAFSISFFFFSCKKEKEVANLDDESINNETVSAFVEKSLTTDEDAVAMRGAWGLSECNWQALMADCAVVTESSETFPKTITIDYGAGCSVADNITKSGMIIIQLTDDLMETGAVRTVTFDNFQVNNTQISGSRVTTNTGTNELGQLLFDRDVNTTLIRNGNTIQRIANEQIIWISGYNTEECGDNVFSVSGSGVCTRPNGTSRMRTITTPLIIDYACDYIASGVIEISGPHGTGSIHFGNGECDDLATVIRPNGNTTTIHLHQN